MDNPGAFLDVADVFYIAPHDTRVEQMEIARGGAINGILRNVIFPWVKFIKNQGCNHCLIADKPFYWIK